MVRQPFPTNSSPPASFALPALPPSKSAPTSKMSSPFYDVRPSWTRGRTVAERNRRLSLPLHRMLDGPTLSSRPLRDLLSFFFFFLSFPFLSFFSPPFFISVPRGHSSRVVFALFYGWLAHWRKGSCYEISMSDLAEVIASTRAPRRDWTSRLEPDALHSAANSGPRL